MTRAKLLVILISAFLAVGLAAGGVWLVTRRAAQKVPLRGAESGGRAAPSAVATGATTTKPAMGAGPIPSPGVSSEPLPVTHLDPKKVLVFPAGSRGLPGEAGVTTLYDMTASKAAPPVVEVIEAPVLVVPSQTAGAGGGAAAPVVSGSADTDGDGLTNDQELQQGTDPKKADTDGDGLSDGDEVKVWKTDPLNPDTDGDGYPDGMEVKTGYNPRGAGKL